MRLYWRTCQHGRARRETASGLPILPHRTHPHAQPRFCGDRRERLQTEDLRFSVDQQVEARLGEAEFLCNVGLALAPGFYVSDDGLDERAAQRELQCGRHLLAPGVELIGLGSALELYQ